MKYINSGTPVELKSLIVSGDLQSNSIVEIYDADRLVARGEWFHDSVLAFSDRWVVASKIGSGRTIKVILKKFGLDRDEKKMDNQFWAVSTKYFDSGKVKATLYAVHAETKPKNSIDEGNMYDHYIDYFNTYEEALQWYLQAKRA